MFWLSNLKKMKAKSKMTTKEIAIKSGIPEPTLEKLFSGATKDPKLKTMYQLVHFLGYTLDDLDDKKKEITPPYTSEAMKLAEDEEHLLELYRELNQEGQEKLIDYTDDLVQSGKYKKRGEAVMGGEEKIV